MPDILWFCEIKILVNDSSKLNNGLYIEGV